MPSAKLSEAHGQDARATTTAEISTRVNCSALAGVIEMGDHAYPVPRQRFTADAANALVEFHLSHAFPVVTSDRTAIHPQVVANSYESLFGKVFNFNHFMRSYHPDDCPRDRILGTIMSVEFPAPPAGGWQVQASRAAAPGIRAVAVMHKAAEGVPEILASWFGGGKNPWSNGWTVSMEQTYFRDTSGFLVRNGADGESKIMSKSKIKNGEPALNLTLNPNLNLTPPDLAALGYTYIPWNEAPAELQACFSKEESRIVKDYLGRETLMLFGGLNDRVQYHGTGLTPLGKEAEAQVAQMLASGIGVSDLEDLLPARRGAYPELLAPLHGTLRMMKPTL